MSEVGVFRKEEIDGKLFLAYTLTQTETPTSSGEAAAAAKKAMYFGVDDLPLQPLFFCPSVRIKFLHSKPKNHDDDHHHGGFMPHPLNSTPHFPCTRSHDQQGESLLDCDKDYICKLPVIPLFWCNHKEFRYGKFDCRACNGNIFSTSYFTCLQCQGKFHKECVESPLEIKHPSHPFHSLRLFSGSSNQKCSCCKVYTPNMYYHCTTCELSMNPVCAMRPVPLVVDHPKSHPHPLSFFPTQASTVCNICAMIKKLDPTYICIQCVFVIHKGCMGFPHIIRISRHPHRISFTSSLPPGNFSCGVCKQQVDNNYGAYSCEICDDYFVHSKCSLLPRIWAGKELEGVPEEDDKIDDGEPFKRIADGIILHPFHSHHMRLEIDKAYDGNKYCRGCALPIYEGQFYSCMECDFILHESCANAPRMKRYPLYPHPLTLKGTTTRHENQKGKVCCSECRRDCNGFFYEYRKEKEIFQLDLRCASIIEPFDYQGHQHPLFLPWDTKKKTRCQMCKYESKESKLICLECDYSICFRCATFPYKARYKHDSHFLTICDGKEESEEPDWCEVCEGKIEEVKETGYNWKGKKTELRYYKCNDCCTALHVDCLFGRDMYIKPGETEKEYLSFSDFSFSEDVWKWMDVRALLNSSLSRPICNGCKCRCPFPIFYKGDKLIFCSWYCLKIEHPPTPSRVSW
ncbi:DC1 [Arabidopsis thaliana x Arabidopsis arenosa]|uniref:Zinc finger PHD-type domain-containing protein n=2 Tax=Arabidopsis TaxID=3701 RepID=A0A178UNC0_ARATH|nr:DC1 [Arabidopsis thaliana x Arabidopsis arenosa]OAO94574.1 hypothetical protein AXX17_AT5G54940 [Arabidopsis thaliana]